MKNAVLRSDIPQRLSTLQFDSTEIRSLLQLLNAKVDSTTQLFPKDVIVTADDIKDLNYRISQKINLPHIHSKSTAISIKYTNQKTMQFTTWDEFQNYSWEEVASIRYITILWEFYIDEEGYQLPQKHSIMVRISSGMKVEEMLQLIMSGKLEEMESLEKDFVPIVCRVDFVNTFLVDDIINLVDKWNKGLKVPEICDNFMYKIKSYRRYIANFVKYGIKLITWLVIFMSTMEIFDIIEVTEVQHLTMHNLKQMSLFIMFIIFGYGTMNWLGQKIAESIFDGLYNYGKTFTFDITKGDKNKQEKLAQIGKKSMWRFIWQLFSALVAGTACSVLSTFITNYMFK